MNTPGSTWAWPERLVARSVSRPGGCLLVWLVVGLASAAGLLRLQIDTSTASFLDRSGPEWATYQRSLERYGGDEFITIALAAEQPWDRSILERIVDLTLELEGVPGVRRVDSLASVPLLRGDDPFGLRTDAALWSGVPHSAEALEDLSRAVRSDRIARRSLLSDDERIFSLNLVLDEDIDADRSETVSQVEEILDGSGARFTGVPVFRTEVNSRTRQELLLFVPLTLVLLALIIAATVGSVVATLVPLIVGLAGAAVALGVMGAVGVPLSLSTTILPSTILALGCAYAAHMVMSPRWVAEDLCEVARPVALSGLTTAIGFLAMATVPIAAIRELATYGAVGVFASTLAALTIAPALLSRAGATPRRRRLEAWARTALRDRLVDLVLRRRAVLLGSWSVLMVGVVAGLTRLEISTDIILWFPRGSDVREDYETVRAQLSGITPVNVLVEATGPGSRDVTHPEVIAAIDGLSTDLNARSDVGKSLSIADPLRAVHRAFSEDGVDRLPSTAGEIEQYLVLLGGLPRLDDVLHFDRRGANILLRVDDNASDRIVGIGDRVASWWQRHGVGDYEARTTGIMYEFARAEEAIAYGQISGLSLAALAIALILFALLRRPGLVAAALIANLAPLGLGFGFMGLVGVPLDAATVCLGSMALGIAVDDTIHLITAFQEQQGSAVDLRERLGRALSRVLPAVLLTTAAVAVGFSVLGLSGFTLIRNLGLVTAGLTTACLLADLTLLPALLAGRVREAQGPAGGLLK